MIQQLESVKPAWGLTSRIPAASFVYHIAQRHSHKDMVRELLLPSAKQLYLRCRQCLKLGEHDL